MDTVSNCATSGFLSMIRALQTSYVAWISTVDFGSYGKGFATQLPQIHKSKRGTVWSG